MNIISNHLKLKLFAWVILNSILFILISNNINKKKIWFANVDQDSMNLIGAIEVNSNKLPIKNEHPGLGTYAVYGNFFKLLNFLKLQSITTLKEFHNSKDPLIHLPIIYRNGRKISIGISLLLTYIFGLISYLLFKDIYLSCITLSSFLFSPGILFQSLVIRNELTGFLFFAITLLALAIAKRLFLKNNILSIFSCLAAGIFSIFSYYTKIQILPYLGLTTLLIPFLFFVKQDDQEFPSKNKLVALILIFNLSLILLLRIIFEGQISRGLNYLIMLNLFSYVPTCFSIIKKDSILNNLYLPSIYVSVFSIGIYLGITLIYYYMFFSIPEGNNLFKEIGQIVFFENTEKIQYVSKWLTFDWKLILSKTIKLYLKFYLFSPFFWLFFFLYIRLIIDKAYKHVVISSLLFILFILLCFINSLRNGTVTYAISPHYFIYSDFFLLVNSIFLVKYYLRSNQRAIILLIIIAHLFYSTITVTKIYYESYNPKLTDAIQFVPRCIYKAANFSNIMINKYGNSYNIIHRIILDNKLNGSKEGIDIFKLPNVKNIFSQKKLIDFFPNEFMKAQTRSILKDFLLSTKATKVIITNFNENETAFRQTEKIFSVNKDITISGFTYDSINKMPASDIYIKIDDQYFKSGIIPSSKIGRLWGENNIKSKFLSKINISNLEKQIVHKVAIIVINETKGIFYQQHICNIKINLK